MAPVRSLPAWQWTNIGYKVVSLTTERNWRTCSSVGGWALNGPERMGMLMYFMPDWTTNALSALLARKLTMVRYPRSWRYLSPSPPFPPPRPTRGQTSAILRTPDPAGAIWARVFLVRVVWASIFAWK